MKKVLLLLLTLAAFSAANAQMLGGSLIFGVPKGDFGNNIDRYGYGINLQFESWQPSTLKPVAFGLNIGYIIYGEESFNRQLSYTNLDIREDVDRKNRLLNFHFQVMVSPFPGRLKPYVELLGGGQYVFTSTSAESESNYGDVFESTNFDDFGWSYGAGAGIMYNLFNGIAGVGKISIDLKARYMSSSEVEYLKESDITFDDQGNVYYTFTRSKSAIDYLSIQLGVMVGIL